MTAQEILDQIESLKSKKSSAEGRLQVLTVQLNKYKVEYDNLKEQCVNDFNCQPKELKSLIARKQQDLETKLSSIEEKLQELQGDE